MKVVDPTTLEVTDLEGSPPDVMAALTASFSVDGRRGVALFQTTNGWREMRSVLVSLTGSTQAIDVLPGTVAFSPDTEFVVARTSDGWEVIALSDHRSPQYQHVTLGPDEDGIRPLGWVDG